MPADSPPAIFSFQEQPAPATVRYGLTLWEVSPFITEHPLSNHPDIFRTTIERNRHLEERNDELERQVDVWANGTNFFKKNSSMW